MAGRLLVVTGTGTNIGKTHVSVALLRALRSRYASVAGFKPVEAGPGEGGLSDARQLDEAASFHVKHELGYRFAEPVSPHLAARLSGQAIELEAVRSMVARVREAADFTLVELAGGLFTPLSPSLLNVDVVQDLRPDVVLLLAPNRLGVLHDVLAATRAAAPLRFSAVVLVAPEVADTSTSHNASELLRFISPIPVYDLPRMPAAELGEHPALMALASAVSTPA